MHIFPIRHMEPSKLPKIVDFFRKKTVEHKDNCVIINIHAKSTAKGLCFFDRLNLVLLGFLPFYRVIFWDENRR